MLAHEGSETISISIGVGSDTRASSSIVLPRGHDLVKHLELLLPQIAQAAAASNAAPPTAHAYASSPMAAPRAGYSAAPLASGYGAARGGELRHHPYLSARSLPPSPYQSDSSRSSGGSGGALPSMGMYDLSLASPSSPSSPSSLSSAHAHSPTQQEQQAAAGGRRRRGAGAAAGKKCQFPGCDKISVSRGLCRGHGGGRRCQHAGCSKGAQSRSDFCWAHGGGQRCEVKSCMRSRKSKRFCVAHLGWEGVPAGESAFLDAPGGAARAPEAPKAIMPRPQAPFAEPSAAALAAPVLRFPSLAAGAGRLPSLQQALQKNQCVGAAAAASHRAPFAHAHAHAVLNGASC